MSEHNFMEGDLHFQRVESATDGVEQTVNIDGKKCSLIFDEVWYCNEHDSPRGKSLAMMQKKARTSNPFNPQDFKKRSK